MSAENLPAAYVHCGEALRAGNRDQWLACLFAPPDKRPHLHTLYAFFDELAGLRNKISQPMAGEIRLQYWRDVLQGRDHGETQGNPLAAAVLDTIARCKLPIAPFVAMIDAHLIDFYDDPMPDTAAFEAWCGETSSAIIRLACLVLADGTDPGGANAAGHAGIALTICDLLRGFPHLSGRFAAYFPADLADKCQLSAADFAARRDSPALRAMLAQMRALARHHAKSALTSMGDNRALIAPAFLTLPLVELTLRQMEKPGYQPFTTRIEVPQWRRQWAMWRAAR